MTRRSVWSRMPGDRLLVALTMALAIGGVALGKGVVLPAHPVLSATASDLLTQPIPDARPNAAQLRRGRSLVIAGDCMSCHLRAGGAPLAGGLGLNTPFGTIYSSNITGDSETGIGAWTPDQFYRAMHDGLGVRGENLYPAFPYPWFRRVSRTDNDAILAWLKTTPAVQYRPPKNDLSFPLNFRFMVRGWNLLFLDADQLVQKGAKSAEWNRGAYLVEGLGHCGACHTPKNAFGADKSGQHLHGGTLGDWVAPDLTGNPRTGLGRWDADEIAEFLQTGRNARTAAGGAMAEVITYSTSLMTPDDLRAIATYLKGQTPSDIAKHDVPDAGAMRRGAAIYSDVCASCHFENGVGQPRYFPPLGNNAMLQQPDPTGLLHLILAGSRVGTSPSRPSPLTMPSFAWKLTDSQIADVGTYIRSSWGNQAAPLKTADVRDVRKRLGLTDLRLTPSSGDRK